MQAKIKQSRRFRRRADIRRRGTELLELGLVLGLILLPVMFGTVEFGTYFYVEHNLQAAAREGARAGCVCGSAGEAQAAADEAIDKILASSSLTQFDGLVPDREYHYNEDGKKYFEVTISTTWDKIPTGLRPMMMIRNAEQHELAGKAAMKIEADLP